MTLIYYNMSQKSYKFIFGKKNNEPNPFKFELNNNFNNPFKLEVNNTFNGFNNKNRFNINQLCTELLVKILSHLIPGTTCDFLNLLKLRQVCQLWKKIFDEPVIWINYSKKIKIYKYLYTKYQVKYNISSFLEKQFQTKTKTNNYALVKSIFNRERILNYDIYNKIIRIYSTRLIDIIGVNTLANAPVINIDHLCLDHVCGTYCCDNNHFLHDKITAPIMRGIDNTGRPFILFVYKNLETNELVYEFIYNNFTHYYFNNIPYSLWTHMSNYCNGYIGKSSHKKSHYNVYNNTWTLNPDRKLLNKSYNYIERLVNGEMCGIPIYESKYDNYWEFGLCQESDDVCPTLHLDHTTCQECIYCENCHYENEVTLYWEDGYLGNKYIKL